MHSVWIPAPLPHKQLVQELSGSHMSSDLSGLLSGLPFFHIVGPPVHKPVHRQCKFPCEHARILYVAAAASPTRTTREVERTVCQRLSLQCVNIISKMLHRTSPIRLGCMESAQVERAQFRYKTQERRVARLWSLMSVYPHLCGECAHSRGWLQGNDGKTTKSRRGGHACRQSVREARG